MPGISGGNAELVAFANLYYYTIRVYHGSILEPIVIEPFSLTKDNMVDSETSRESIGVVNLA
ncbi:hypothetical protein DSO57_1031917 [Entomophthora muscae]|uniref:Uncharacterized protein n=1 Tax=Entomophthora muscae TaxID=34485 RepID=A0ACC2TMK0_9FUNG|nr:hypothetical protein DSO57_1031917 [Entomophthora muscae]